MVREELTELRDSGLAILGLPVRDPDIVCVVTHRAMAGNSVSPLGPAGSTGAGPLGATGRVTPHTKIMTASTQTTASETTILVTM